MRRQGIPGWVLLAVIILTMVVIFVAAFLLPPS